MENKLEQLLNSLIEKGWKPRGFEKVYNFGIVNGYTVLDTKKANYINFATSCVFREDYGEEQEMDYVSYTYRELVSKESGLWQFVCENGMIYSTPDDRGGPNYNWLEDLFNCGWKHPDYWLMESALCDESEFEDFLLSNIVIKDEE